MSLSDAMRVRERVAWVSAEDDDPDKWAALDGGHEGMQKFVVPLARVIARMSVWLQA